MLLPLPATTATSSPASGKFAAPGGSPNTSLHKNITGGSGSFYRSPGVAGFLWDRGSGRAEAVIGRRPKPSFRNLAAIFWQILQKTHRRLRKLLLLSGVAGFWWGRGTGRAGAGRRPKPSFRNPAAIFWQILQKTRRRLRKLLLLSGVAGFRGGRGSSGEGSEVGRRPKPSFRNPAAIFR